MESMKCEVVKSQIPTVEVSNRQLFMKSAKVTTNSSVGRRVHFVLSMYVARVMAELYDDLGISVFHWIKGFFPGKASW